MIEFSLEKFNPTVAELTTLSEKYKGLKIAGIDDKEGYEIVKNAESDLRAKRIYIKDTLKKYREDAIAFQKAVIVQENSLVEIIESTEKELKAERKRIDEEVEMEKRKKVLPARMDELERCGLIGFIEFSDELILSMSSDEFNKFVMDKREEKMKAKEAKLAEEQKALDEAKAKKEREDELERIRKDAEEKAIKETEARLKREQQEKEEKEKQAKIDEEIKIKKEQEKLEKDKKYNARLKEYGYNENDFMIVKNGNENTMWKRVSTFII